MHMSLDTDFSHINLQYLLQVRDVARQEPDLVVALLGIPKELVDPLAKTSAHSLSVVTNINDIPVNPFDSLKIQSNSRNIPFF